jgi:hypothetical protein
MKKSFFADDMVRLSLPAFATDVVIHCLDRKNEPKFLGVGLAVEDPGVFPVLLIQFFEGGGVLPLETDGEEADGVESFEVGLSLERISASSSSMRRRRRWMLINSPVDARAF